MQFSDNEIIALLFGTSLSEPGGMYVLLQLVPAVNQKRLATNSGDGKTLTTASTSRSARFGQLKRCTPRSRAGLAAEARIKITQLP
jgi:hypothetical protein